MNDIVQIWNPVSTLSGEVDRLFIFLMVISVLATGLICVLIIWFSVRYRKRPGQAPARPLQKGHHIEIFLIGVPFFIFMVIFAWGARIYFTAMNVPADTLQIFGVGKQWMWKFQHPQGKREINELHVPIGRPVQVTLISQDAIHGFYVPAFRVKMDVLPKRYTNVWFEIKRAGKYPLFCAEYCGLGHSRMRGTVHAMTQAQYDDWLQEGSGEGMFEASAGEELYHRFSCYKCHDTPDVVPSPPLSELYGRAVRLADGRTVTADEKYLRESIVYPGKDIVQGYPNVMPSFQSQLTETEIVDLIIFIKSLGARKAEGSAPGTESKTYEYPTSPK